MAHAALQAVAGRRRREILRLVWDAELSSSQIAAHFDTSWAAVSQNIRVLREAGLLRERRDGPRRFYRADRKALGPLQTLLRSLWEDDLRRLKTFVEEEGRRRKESKR